MGREAPGGDRAGRSRRDRELFDGIASRYVAKDEHPASRIARIRRLEATWALAGPPPTCTLWEIGCGGGFAARYLHGRYRAYRGIDHSEALVALARRRHDDLPAACFEAGDLLATRPDAPPDVILAIGVLHHLPDPGRALNHLVACLRPGGWILTNEPLRGNPAVRLARRLRKRLDPAYSEDQASFARGELASLMQEAGLEERVLRPQGVFSTPFAEIPLGPMPVTRILARLAVRADRFLEARLHGLLWPLAWNVAAAGRRPRGS